MKNLKSKVLTVLMAVALVFGMIPFTVSAANPSGVEILLNGKALVQNEEIGFAVIKDGRTMVPLRLVVEALGFKADWQVDGPQVITMQGRGTTVYHKVGELRATSVNPLSENPTVIATTDVPSYVDKVTGRTMVGLRLVSEAFGVDVQWKRNDTGGGQVIMTMAGVAESSGTDVVWLDSDNFVLRSQITNRLSQHKVRDSRETDGVGISGQGRTRTIAEQAKDWEPPATFRTRPGSEVVGRDVLVQRAVEYMEGVYNVNYRTDTAEQWLQILLTHWGNPGMSPADSLRITDFGKAAFQSIQNQQLIMEAKFITDETLVYTLNPLEATLDRTGTAHNDETPWAVRGTMFYRFESNLGGSFWRNAGYEIGKWYWQDVEVRFGVSDANSDSQLAAATHPNKTVFFGPDGTQITVYEQRPTQPLSILP